MLKRKLNDKCRYYISALVLLSSNFAISSFIPASQTHAIDYQTQITPTFTVNDALSMTVSSDILSIDDLAPGLSKDSNIIDITVASNNLTGYTLRAAVGDSTYDNTDLTNSADGTTFTSLTAEAATLADIASDKWGYSFCQGTGCSSWSSYNGLPLYSVATATLKATDGASAGDTVRFKVAAKAGSTKAAGTYENRISFSVTANPIVYMQDVATWGGTLAVGDSIEAIDSRDGKSYWVTKLSDGSIWMTQNLDLNLSTGTTLTSNDTDLTKYDETTYTDAYSSTGGYSKDATTGVISWKPSKSTIDATSGDSAANDAIKSGWNNDNNVINSADVGLWYQTSTYYNSSLCSGNSYQGCNYLTKGTNYSTAFSQTPDATSGTHGAIGNYYDYAAAIAANTIPSNWRAANVEPGNSICPKGWRLPSKVSGDFSTLNTNYNSSSTSSDTGLFGAPLYLPRAGYVNASGLDSAGYYGYYWTGTVNNTYYAYNLYFDSTVVYPANGSYRFNGRAVRCIAR